jgi:hypothetical protein
MVKYASLEDENFRKIVRRVDQMVRRAVRKIEQNWKRWERVKGMLAALNWRSATRLTATYFSRYVNSICCSIRATEGYKRV